MQSVSDAATSITEVFGRNVLRKPPPQVVFFVDELNTAPTSTLAMIKECFVDGSLDGIELPANIFWAGAINPSSRPAPALPCLGDMSGPHAPRGIANHIGIGEATPTAELDDFVVREMPLALQHLVLDYDRLSSEQERQLLAEMFHTVGIGSVAVDASVNAKAFEHHLISIVLACQEYVRGLALWRIHVSIRDTMRALKLYCLLLQPVHRAALLPDSCAGAGPTTHWCAIIMAVTLAYHLRLASGERGGMGAEITRVLSEQGCPNSIDRGNVVDECLHKVFRATAVSRGIACTQALMENIYACVACLEAGIPLNITGPPGCVSVWCVVSTVRLEYRRPPPTAGQDTFSTNSPGKYERR